MRAEVERFNKITRQIGPTTCNSCSVCGAGNGHFEWCSLHERNRENDVVRLAYDLFKQLIEMIGRPVEVVDVDPKYL
jgi:hypothetical protein